jgi:hypothetical protein
MWQDWSLLFRYPFALGVDGYYYVLQITEFLRSGRFYFRTNSPLVLYAAACLTDVTGNPILSVKILSLALHTALCLGIFSIVTTITRSPWLGVLGATLAVFSGAHLYMVLEYINQLGSLTFLVWAVWCAMQTLRTRSKGWLVCSLIFFSVACLSHRSALPLLVSISVLALLIYTLTADRFYRRYGIIALLITLVLWCIPIILAFQSLIRLPVWLQTELLMKPRIPLSQAAAAEQIILLVIAPTSLLVIFIAGKRLSNHAPLNLIGSISLFALLLTVNPFLNYSAPSGIAWRLSILAYLELGLLIPGFIGLITRLRREAVFLVAAFVLPLIIGSRVYSRPYGLRPDYLERRATLLENLPRYRGCFDSSSIVVASHGDEFVATYTLGVRAQQTWPLESVNHVYWLLNKIEPQTLTLDMLALARDEHGTFTILAEDSVVQRRLGEITESERHRLLFNNSHLYEYLRSKTAPA